MPVVSTSRWAPGSSFVLKPMTTASDADARLMSLSLMSPAPSRRMLIRTSVVLRRSSAWRIAPSEPCTSVFSTTRSSATSLAWMAALISSRLLTARPSPAMPAAAVVSASVTGGLLVRNHAEDVAGLGQALEADDLDRRRRLGLLDALAGGIVQRADAAPRATDADDLADCERAGLDEDGGHVAAALVDLRLDDRPDRLAVRVGLEVLEVGDEEDHLHQVVDPGALLGADRDGDDVAAVLLDQDLVVGELLLHPVRVGVGLVDLVDRHDHRHARRADVVDRLLRLRHDAVVGGHDDDRDVGDLGATRAHRGEGLVARRVEEDDALAVVVDLGRADVLGDAAALAGRRPSSREWRRAGSSCRGRRGP